MKNLFFSKEQVLDAEWIIQTDNQLNHGLPHTLWAWKVINWYLNFYNKVKQLLFYRRKLGIKTTVQETVNYIANQIKADKCSVAVLQGYGGTYLR